MLEKMANPERDSTWDTSEETRLIELWQNYPCLYQLTSGVNKNVTKRNKAYKDMGQELKKPADVIKTRIESLRRQYNKAKEPPKSGSGGTRKLTSRQVWILEHMAWIGDYVKKRESKSNMDDTESHEYKDEHTEDTQGDNSDDSETASEIGTPGSNPTPPPGKNFMFTKKPLPRPKYGQKRKKPDDNASKERMRIMESLVRSIEDDKDESEEQITARYWAKELTKIKDDYMRHKAEYEINQILFEAKVGSLEGRPRRSSCANQPVQHTHPVQYHYSSGQSTSFSQGYAEYVQQSANSDAELQVASHGQQNLQQDTLPTAGCYSSMLTDMEPSFTNM